MRARNLPISLREYGLIAAGISLAIIAVVNGLGSKLNTKFTSINTSLK
ncbi:MAG: Flp family type IVb pilin [Bradyrhizobium sp.]|nr:Flp family type IVb pilin [Bradyrhizobium sp.]THD45848.1 MAG: Flp family type IVb pilin [Bradyrhizobium sp.]